MTPSADQSAAILTDRIRKQLPTAFWRIGDGALEGIYNRLGQTCDGERYREDMGRDLCKVIAILAEMAPLGYLGDWASATNGSKPRYVDTWVELLRPIEGRLLNFEALLLNRRTFALIDFYRAVRADGRRKLIVGAEFNRRARTMLNAEYLPVPMVDLYAYVAMLRKQLRKASYDVLLFGAGLAGLIPIVEEWQAHPDRTYIHLGSALDPLFKGRTRMGQLDIAVARKFFAEML
jgi:hypothetical protein